MLKMSIDIKGGNLFSLWMNKSAANVSLDIERFKITNTDANSLHTEPSIYPATE